MTHGKIKTALLTVLIASSIVLSIQIWTSEKLWPEGYDFFSVSPKNFVSVLLGRDTAPEQSVNIRVTGALDSVFSPRTVMLSYNDGRVSYSAFQGQGKNIAEQINGVLYTSFLGEIQSCSETEWQNALKDRNLYADYNVSVGFSEMSSFLGIKKDFENRKFDKAVILPFSDGNSVKVYFRDSDNETYYKCSPKYDSKNIENIFITLASGNMLNLSYAYELNLDKKLTGENEVHQKVLMESYVLLPLDDVNMSEISPIVPDISDETHMKNIAKALKFNLLTSKRYTQTDTKDIYINSGASIAAAKNGYFEYQASEENSGITVSSDNDFSGAAASAAEIIDDILSNFEISDDVRLYINSPLISGGEESTLYFDYFFAGDPVDMGDGRHGCEIKISRGKITSVKMYIRDFKKISDGNPVSPLSVIDKLYTMNDGKDVVIDSLHLGYEYQKGKMPLNWFAKVNGENTIIKIE